MNGGDPENDHPLLRKSPDLTSAFFKIKGGRTLSMSEVLEEYEKLVYDYEQLHLRKVYLLQTISDRTVESPFSYGNLVKDHRLHDCQG